MPTDSARSPRGNVFPLPSKMTLPAIPLSHPSVFWEQTLGINDLQKDLRPITKFTFLQICIIKPKRVITGLVKWWLILKFFLWKWKCRHWVVSNSLWPQGLYPASLLCPWNSPGKSTGVRSCSLRQGIFLTQGSNPGLFHCTQILYQLNYQGSPYKTGLTTIEIFLNYNKPFPTHFFFLIKVCSTHALVQPLHLCILLSQ